MAAIALLAACPRPAAHGERVASAATREVADTCLAPAEEFSLGGYRVYAPAAEALARAGRPLAVARDSSEDDGGMYELTIYRYPDFEVEVVRGLLDVVRARSPALATPSGVRAGLTRAEAARLLARHGVTLPAHDTMDVADCSGPSAYLTLVFDPAGRVATVEVVAARP